ncbi:hypothetical protein AMECASPLE_011394 [Ameca splendens]|uniref:Uncharacterized protein n=1 Tax=Ameca splendens TaxID=208324 RepID=A0ABV0ZKH9_9TELE
MKHREKSEWKQKAERPGPKDRGGSILPSFSLLAAFTPVPAVALALEVHAESLQLCLAGGSRDLQLPALTRDPVSGGAEVQIHVAVRCAAKTAAAEFAQHLTALLCCCGHIEEVMAQRSQQIAIQGRAAGLQHREMDMTSKRQNSSLYNIGDKGKYCSYTGCIGGVPPEDHTRCSNCNTLTNGGDQICLQRMYKYTLVVEDVFT